MFLSWQFAHRQAFQVAMGWPSGLGRLVPFADLVGTFFDLLPKGLFVARQLDRPPRLEAFDLLAQSFGSLDLTFLRMLVRHFCSW
jgi:hypothetical protein